MNPCIKIFIATGLYLCRSLSSISAQCPDTAALNITATLYTQENGLTSNMLVNITKDSIGFRYFLGVDGKWVRYDGVNFKVRNEESFNEFDLTGFNDGTLGHYKEQYIKNVAFKYEKTKEGTSYKWGFTLDSLIWVDASQNLREAFPLPNGLISNPYSTFYPNSEVCWITTPEKVFRFDLRSKRFHRILLPDLTLNETHVTGPLSIFFRSDGSPYLLRYNMILKLNTQTDSVEIVNTFSKHPRNAGFPKVILDKYLFVVESNTILHEINLDNGEQSKFDLTRYSTFKNSKALNIVGIENYHNYLLIGTSNAGLFIYNLCTNSMQHFQYGIQNSDTDLTNSVIWIAVDDEDVIWLQTDAGLIKLEVNHQPIKTYMPSSIKKGGVCNNCNNVRAIYNYDKNNLLIGTLEGVYKFNLVSNHIENFISPVDHQPVWNDRAISAITGDKRGNIFIANWTNEGILLVNNETKKLVNILPRQDYTELTYTYLRCLLYDSHHVLWVGTTEGFLRIMDIEEFQKNNYQGKLNVSNRFPGVTEHSSHQPNSIFAISEDSKGNIWVGAKDGLYVYNYGNNSVIKYSHESNNEHSLSENEVRSIYFSSDDDVWIGTNGGGLNHFEGSTKTFNAFTIEDGLPNNSIYTILEDKYGFLWLGTNAGICRFNKTDHSVRNYTPRDGIQNFEFNTNAVCSSLDGRFCFGGRTGFNIFHPDSMNIAFSAPRVAITKFKIFDQEIPLSESILYLPHTSNSFTFDFVALSYFRSNDNQYTYMMEGADKDWTKAGNRQYTSYNNLQPGSYKFKVRAANYTGTWSDEVTSMEIVINPAWYNTWWFRILITLFIAAVIYGLYRYRLRQMMNLQDIRNRIASDLHDEIGSTLSSISLSSTIIQSKLNGSNSDVTKLLQQVSNNTDTMMEALSDIVWAINTRNDRFDNVVNRMRAFAIELLEPRNIQIDFKVSEDMHDVHLDMQHRRNLYLIFKEAMNNIVKYSGCNYVRIEIRREGGKTFIMNIKDDGVGFEVAGINKEGMGLSGNGIMNMKKRAEELGGQLTIDANHGKGVELNLRFSV